MNLAIINRLYGKLKGIDLSIGAQYFVIIVISVICSLILVLTQGNIIAAVAFVTVLAILFLTYYRVDWSFYLFFGMVLFFDQFLNDMPLINMITYKAGYFLNLKQNPLLPEFSAGVMNPIEIQLVLILIGWFISIVVRRSKRVQGIPFWGFALLLAVAIVLSEFHGLQSGGKFLPSLWEIRALIYFLILYFLVPQIIQTKKQLKTILWIFIIMVGIKALQGTVRFAYLGFKFGGYDVLTNHEDPLFIGDLLIMLIGFSMFGVKTKQRSFLLWSLPILLLGFYSGQRRASYAGFFVAFGLFIVMLTTSEKLKFFRRAYPVLMLIALYTVIFWNRESRLAAPLQLIKSGFSDTQQGAGDRYYSNLGREIERYDLAATVQAYPIFGVGFGQKYLQPLNLNLGISPWPLRSWIPHDEILWLIAKMGAVGFFIFWLFFDSLLFEAGMLSRKLEDPYLRAVIFTIAGAIVAQMVVSYFDLQLTYYRNMVVLGTLCGLFSTIKQLGKGQNGNMSFEELLNRVPETVTSE
jgi:hypothetical protein